METRPFGRLIRRDTGWEIKAEPQVMARARRVFARAPTAGMIELSHSDEICMELRWFMQLYPMIMDDRDREFLHQSADAYGEQIHQSEDVLTGRVEPRQYDLAIPARIYQRQASDLWLARKKLLLGDQVGLGKTVAAICGLTDPRTQPGIVVCLPSLRVQWEEAFCEFAPEMNVHRITSSTVSRLPTYENGRGPDVVIISYGMLASWGPALAAYGASVVFDECQELRRVESQKYDNAKLLAGEMQYVLGLSGTPVYNYGGEIWNVIDAMMPGVLGTWREFKNEWCSHEEGKAIVTDPAALGAHLRRSQLMLRRLRSDVGRELPDVIRITHKVDADIAAFNAGTKSKDASELARIIMANTAASVGSIGSREAMGQLDNMLRQATGVAKAPHVADFVDMLLESGEKVVLYGWHRAVYQIWLDKLCRHNPAMFTGTESNAAKEREKKRFVNGDTNLLIMSVRAGVGVDGLQDVCKTCVFGELDWSWSVIEQAWGRFQRDGQKDTVTAFFLTSDSGLDPIMTEVLGIKRGQMQGIVDGKVSDLIRKDIDKGAILREFARKVLR